MDKTAKSEDLKWPQMNVQERFVCVGKMIVTLLTGGFVFPRSMDPFLKN